MKRYGKHLRSDAPSQGRKRNKRDSVTAVLKAAGLTVDPVQVKALVASLSEVNIDEAIKAAPTMMAAPQLQLQQAQKQNQQQHHQKTRRRKLKKKKPKKKQR